MPTIVYLDVDDEITSAAARLRAAGEREVALVLPYGSRLATSRINFRLLAREAQARERALVIVAGDAATRALAASAGLPVHATVGDFEATVAGGDGAVDARSRAAEDEDGIPPGTGASGGIGAADGEAADSTAAATATARRGSARRTEARAEDLEATVVGAPVPGRAEPARAARADAIIEAPSPGSPRGRSIKVVGPRRGFSRPAMLAGLAALLAVVLVGGVAAYVFLPSATITVTPRVDPVVPVSFEVRADPAVVTPDPDAGTVPAERVTIPVGVNGTFPATGKRIEETRASGVVRFTSENTFVPVTIPAGTRVSTQSGVAFSTRESVTVERASFITGPTSATVAVDAQVPGPGGNVAAGTITELSGDISQFLISVTNPDATSGGTRNEFPRVEQADVDGAVTELTAQLETQFAERLADPSTTPSGRTLFPGTAALGAPTPSVDPATLVGQEVASFDLGMTAEGAVTVVDEAPLEALAADRIRDAVDPGYRLIEASIEIDPGDPFVEGEAVVFPLSARASQVAVLDRDELLAAIKGRPVHQARAILEEYGRVEVTVWPDWVTTIPTLDARLSLEIDEVGADTPSPSRSPSPSRPPSGAPSGSASPGLSPTPSPEASS